MIVDQVLFGYADGHRQLAGSRRLDPEAASLLLGATDATIDRSTDRLVTGLPLPTLSLYAVAVTWAALDRGRPGAVWAHTILVDLADLGRMAQPAALLAQAHRPSSDDFARYSEPLSFRDVETVVPAADPRLIADVLNSSASSDASRVVVHGDLQQAEAALLTVWTAQWPALRASFAFRTRDTVRPSPNSPFVTVARRARGMAGVAAGTSTVPHWIRSLSEAPSDLPGGLRSFLRHFGPEQPTTMRSMIELAEIHELVRGTNRPTDVARALEARYDSLRTAPKLKSALFGPEPQPWWKPTQLELVIAILGAEQNAWDPGRLRLDARVEQLILQGQAAALLRALNPAGPRPLRRAVIGALTGVASPSLVGQIARASSDIAVDVLRHRPDLARDPKTWRDISEIELRSLLPHLGGSDDLLVAVMRAGHVQVVVDDIEAPRIVRVLVDANELTMLSELRDRVPSSFDPGPHDAEPRVHVALAACRWRVDRDSLLRALETTRSRIDETWLRAAVILLAGADDQSLSAVLQTVFGPLHHAVTDDRLPRDSWRELEAVLPDAHDPALRLRRLLVDVARSDKWSGEELERAVREGGPFVAELRHDIDDDEPLWVALKAVIRALRRVTG